MRLRFLAVLAFALFAAGSLFGQDVAGTWQGTLAPPGRPPLRIVFKLAKAADGKLRVRPSPSTRVPSRSSQYDLGRRTDREVKDGSAQRHL
jgi:hypothetical protein